MVAVPTDLRGKVPLRNVSEERVGSQGGCGIGVYEPRGVEVQALELPIDQVLELLHLHLIHQACGQRT